MRLTSRVHDWLRGHPQPLPPFTQRVERVLTRAAERADERRGDYVSTEDIALALLDEPEGPHTKVIKPRIKVKT